MKYKAAMPIPYIIALILGVVVVALLAYWFISTGGKGGGVGKEAECRARILEMCVSGTTALAKAQEVCSQAELDKKCDACKIIPNWDKKILGCP